ncbi:MAG: hypothetical protein NTX22_04450 [Ignavibacteriales bacterium]|nr:hypothetical protein [Ignavibacteriales bacterium]
MLNLTWLNDIDLIPTLQGDPKAIAETCGSETLIKLIENDFTKMKFYIPANALDDAKKMYVRKFYDGKNLKTLCRMLKVSDSQIYKWISEPMNPTK